MASEKRLSLSVDKAALRETLAKLSEVRGTNEWCFACGAGAASVRLETPTDAISRATDHLLTNPDQLQAAISQFREIAGDTEWCFACGAGAKSSPMAQVVNPADLSDEVIDQLSDALVRALNVK